MTTTTGTAPSGSTRHSSAVLLIVGILLVVLAASVGMLVGRWTTQDSTDSSSTGVSTPNSADVPSVTHVDRGAVATPKRPLYVSPEECSLIKKGAVLLPPQPFVCP